MRLARSAPRLPAFVGGVTLVAGVVLLAAPGRVGGRLGLDDQDAALRAIGASDLVLVPGLLLARPRWPWMVARAALNLAQAAYINGVAPRSSSPRQLELGARLLVGLTAMDGATGLVLRRLESP